MKKTAKTAAIALALTAAAGLASCYGVYGSAPEYAPDSTAAESSTPDKAAQNSGADGADSPEKDSSNSA